MTQTEPLELDVVEYLSSKGVKVYKAAGDEVTAHCFFCQSASNQKGKGKLYINTVEGLYQCKVCGEAGNARTLMRHFGDKVESKVDAPRANRRAMLELATSVGEQMLANNDAIIEYLLGPKRGLSAETVLEARIGYVPKGWSLTGSMAGFTRDDLKEVGLLTATGRDFYEDRITIPYLSRGAVVALRGKDPASKYFTAAGDSVRLYNADVLDGADDVIVTEGEFDCLVLQQHLRLSTDPRIRKIAVVGLPGTQALPANFESYFKDAKRVFIGFDPDDAGIKGALRIKEMLGTRARILELPDDLPKCDWSEYFQRGHTWKHVSDMLAEVSGKRLFTMAEAGRKWRTQRATVPGIKLGYQLIDETIKPGLLPGQVLVVLANTGTGKTVFACNIAFNTRQKRHLFVSLEMTAEEVYERLWRIYQFHYPHATNDEIDAAFAGLMICDENRLNGKDVDALLAEFEEEMGGPPELVTVDYLGYFARGVQGSGHYEKTSEAIMALKALAKARKVAMIVPHQVNRGAKDGRPLESSDARDSGVVEETADFVMTIYRPDDALKAVVEDKNGRLVLGLPKSRHGGKGRTFNLVFAQGSLAIVDAMGKLARRAEQENYLIDTRGYDYEQVRAEQTKPVQQVIVYGVPKGQA
ncbi:MAG: DnaB-like helicase C-terminal domain-containing protein [Oryzihumus sp.]